MSNKQTILIVEDEASISNFMTTILTANNYTVLKAEDAKSAVSMITSYCPDLVLLDLGLPDADGLEVLNQVREWSVVPIIVVSARDREREKVEAFDLGADDYMTKPFSIRELTARVKANLRRTIPDENSPMAASAANIISSGELEINTERYEVTKRGQVIVITLREFELLKYLAERENRVFSREQLLEEVWGYEYYGDIRTVDVTVRRLREKLEDDSSDPKYIMTKRGIGYYFKRP